MLERFSNILKSLQIPEGSRIIIATSGGLDSVALVHLLCNNNSNLKYNLELAHITHNMRSQKEGEKDLRLVKMLSQKYSLHLYHHTLNSKNIYKYGKEQEARTLRRQWLLSLCDAKHDFIALAHHEDDQLETLVMRLQEHYSLKGLIGISKTSFPFIRPLLLFTKKELKQYLLSNSYEWNEDETNKDMAIKRNATRNMLTDVKKSWPSLAKDMQHLAYLADQHQNLLKYLLNQELLYSTYSSDEFIFKYPYKRFIVLHHTIQQELIFYWFDTLMKHTVKPDYRLPYKFLSSINLRPNGSTLLRGHGIIIKRIKTQIFIMREINL